MHPVIILWAHPRSMSTAIERIMRERGDIDCLHEPFLHYYYLGRSGKPLPHFDSEQNHPTSYLETRDLILQRAEDTPVFAKDMSYYVMPEILDDTGFCTRIQHCFLIRDPLRSIVSYFKLDPDVELDEIGMESQWWHLQGLQQMGINNSVVLEAEAVQDDPAQAMRRLWEPLGLDFKEQALNWEQGSMPGDWEYVQGWHQNVSESQGIRALSEAEAEQAKAEFDLLCARAPQLMDYLQHHLPCYQRLRAHS
ncbi:MAG: hypothetical protein ACR2P6_04650, partial [Gammaproteobacteria bacterium]